MEKPRLKTYAESGNEKRAELVPMDNLSAEFGQPHSFPDRNIELNAETVVDLDIRALTRPDCPLVMFGRPHVGEYVPSHLIDRMTEGGKKAVAIEDRGTQEVFKSNRIPSVGFKISRFVVDPNRAPELGDPSLNAMGQVLWYTPVINEKGEFDADGRTYEQGQEPNAEEVQDLVERFYMPYYQSLLSVVGALADRRTENGQRVLFIDGHSFPLSETVTPYYKKYGNVDSEKWPLFIIGDRGGTSCDPDIRDAFARALENTCNALSPDDRAHLMRNQRNDAIVGLNDPFNGVHNVRFFGERNQGVNALQLEVSEGPFMDNPRGDWYSAKYDERGRELVRQIVESATLAVDPLLKNQKR